MPPSGVDPRLNFVIDADNRASAKMDAVTSSADRLTAANSRLTSTYSRLTDQDLAQASEWFDRTYGSATKTATATVAMGEAAEETGRRTALAAERMSGGLLMVARSGEVSARGIRSLLGGATDLAFAFGPEGAWLTAITIAGLALSEFWDRQQKEADKAAKEYQKVLDIIKKLSIGEQQATAATAQGEVDALNRTIANLRSQMAASRGESAVGFAKEIEQVEKLRDAAQVLATAAKDNAERDAQERHLKQQAEEMRQDISDLEARLSTARKEAADAKKTGVGPEEDPAKLASELAAKRAALVKFYDDEHAFMQVNRDDEVDAINTEARRYAQGEQRAAQEQRFAAQRQAKIEQLKLLKDATKALNEAAEQGLKPITKNSRDYINSIGELPDAKELSTAARTQIAHESGNDPASKALIKAHDDQVKQQQKDQAKADKIELDAMRAKEKMKLEILTGSVDVLVRAHKDLGRQLLLAALEPEVSYLEGLAVKEFYTAAADAFTGNFKGAAEHTLAAGAYVAGARLIDSIAQGGSGSAPGGGGGSGGGGGGGSTGGADGTPGTFRPTDQGQGNGSFTLNLITKHPASPDVVQSVAYQLNRSNVLKQPPIQIPPTAGLQPFQG